MYITYKKTNHITNSWRMELIALVLLFTVTLLETKAEDTNPCDIATIVKDEYRRSSNYKKGSDGEDTYLCDRYLQTGWYIFEGHQGHEMPTSPPGLGQCGTDFPVWLKGTLPKEEDGIVDREACSQGLLHDCYLSYGIKIKNCGDNYAYYLIPTTQSCPEAYCIGDKIPCASGESSENGYTPDCTNEGFPILTHDPTISFRVGEYELTDDVTMREVVMQCNIEHNETDVFFDVVWFIADVKVAEHIGNNSIAYNDMPAELFENEWFGEATLDNEARCELRARYGHDKVPGPMKSAEYYMGFVVEDLVLIVEEGGDPALYTVRPTIPVLCPIDINCTLKLEILEPHTNGTASTCPNGRKLKQTAVEFPHSKCSLVIPMVLNPDENTIFSMEVYAATDNNYDGDHEVNLAIRSPEYHQFHSIWQNYTLPSVHVNVIDKDADIAGLYCKAHNDPHFVTMDGRMYDNHLAGEFVLYRHKHLPVQINAYFLESGTYSRVCGAAVRSGGDLFIYDTCIEAEDRIRLYQCEDMNLAIEKQGNDIHIELPHGTKVHLTSTTIIIYPSLGDLNSIEGLCGKFDQICGNDFVGGDGSIHVDSCAKPDCSNVEECKREKRHDFAKTWIVEPEDSLYEGNIPTDLPKPDIIYCSCANVTEGDEIIQETTCQRSKSLEFCIAGGVGDFEDQCVHNKYKMMSSYAGSDDVIDEVGPFEYDPNFNPPEPEWKDPWTEELARVECEQFMADLQGFDTCLNIPNVNMDEVISTCIEDIKITGNTEFNAVHANGLLSACLTEITKNMSYFNFNSETGEMEPPNDLTHNICSVKCLNNGTCINQTCQCTDGYFGKDCSFDENKIPTLYSIPNGGMCDKRTRPCQQTPVTGNYFLDKDTLSCHIEVTVLSVTELISLGEVKMKATFDHYQRVMCPLPEMSVSKDEELVAMGYTVAVSNDGKSKSDTREMVKYDSLCMNCSVDLECYQLVDTCFIDSNCYARGNSAPADPCQFCDPDYSSRDWIKAVDGECAPPGDTNTGLIVGASLLIVAIAATATIGGVFISKKKKKNVVHVEMEERTAGEANE